jgi:hypothetical protein
MVRVVILHSRIFCILIALSTRAATRRSCLLERSLADRSSQKGGRVRDSIMTTIIHSVSRVTSAGSSEELAESRVNKLLGWQPRTPSYRWEGLS